MRLVQWCRKHKPETILLTIVGLFFTWHGVLAWRCEVARGQLRAHGYPATWPEVTTAYEAKSTPSNAAPIYKAAFANYSDENADALPIVGDADTPPPGQPLMEPLAGQVTAYLAARAETIAKLRQAAALPRAHFPLESPIGGMDISHDIDVSQNLRQAARLFALDALQAEAAGDLARQLSDITSCYQLATHRYELPNDIDLLVGIAIEGIGHEAATRLLNAPHVTEQALTQLSAIAAPRDDAALLRHAFGGEFVRWTEMLAGDDLDAKTIGLNQLSQFGEWTEEYAETITTTAPSLMSFLGYLTWGSGILQYQQLQLYRNALLYVRAFEAPFPEIVNTEPPTLIDEGSLMVNFEIQTTIPIAMASVRNKLLRAACTLKRQQLQSGAYPEHLEDLHEEFARGDFEDLFTGKPFRYVREDGHVKLYSLGRNRKDNGGDGERYADIVIAF